MFEDPYHGPLAQLQGSTGRFRRLGPLDRVRLPILDYFQLRFCGHMFPLFDASCRAPTSGSTMSEPLSKSFSNLTVVTAPPKIQIALPNFATDGRVCFYGYDISMEWLIDYAIEHWCWGPLAISELSKIIEGLGLLSFHSGINSLKFESAQLDHAAPSNTVTMPGYRRGEIRVPVISIFSDEGWSFRKRPSQEQVDRLSEIMGKQPRWWIDHVDSLLRDYQVPPAPGPTMSEPLSSSFNNLTVTAPPKIQMALPNLATDGRVCFYGYDISMEWLIDYAIKHWCWGSIDRSELSKITGGLRLLGLNSGINCLKFESALMDHAAPSNAVTMPGYRRGEIRVPVLSIFSDEGSSFRKRPSQEQVDRLSELMGKQPRWWIDYEDPRTYGQ